MEFHISEKTTRGKERKVFYSTTNDPMYLEAKRQALKDFTEMKKQQSKEKPITKWRERYFTGGETSIIQYKYVMSERMKLRTGIIK
jgi:hypothetical protein